MIKQKEGLVQTTSRSGRMVYSSVLRDAHLWVGTPTSASVDIICMDQKGSAAMLTAGDTPVVILRIQQGIYPGFEILFRSPKQGYQWPHKKKRHCSMRLQSCVHAKNIVDNVDVMSE